MMIGRQIHHTYKDRLCVQDGGHYRGCGETEEKELFEPKPELASEEYLDVTEENEKA